MLESSYRKEELELTRSNLNATLLTLGLTAVLLANVQEQTKMAKETMEENAKFHRELLQTLDVIIKNQ